MKKIISFIALLSACSFFACINPAAAVSETGRHVSNRIKIERPGILGAQKVKPVATPEEKEEAEVPVARPEPVVLKPEVPVVPDKPEEAAITPAPELLPELSGRFYSRKGRADPFEPFLFRPEPEVTSTEQEQLQIRTPQTPLERMDLAQLRVAGILQAAGMIRALVQEASGKGYVINEGTYIGNKGGQVSKILPDRVVVEEKYLDIYGKIAVRERELKLQN